MKQRSGQPDISVVLSVHNGEAYLRGALDGILAQTYENFELVVVNDGSTDATGDILGEYAARDSRVVTLVNETNIGLTRSLNHGLKQASGEFVARHDADDLSDPERFAKQVAFLRERTDIGLCGTAYNVIDGNGERTEVYGQPVSDTSIRWQMLFHNAFCHSSVMFRRQLVLDATGGYDETCRYGQDYDLWARTLRATRAANLDEPLISFRVHGRSISTTRREEQQRVGAMICAREINRMMLQELVSEAEGAILRRWYYVFPREVEASCRPLCDKLMRLTEAFLHRNDVDAAEAATVVLRWRKRIEAAGYAVA